MKATVGLHVSYSQIAVFDSTLQRPFNDWTSGHVAQGFAWRPGSVSFRTLVESGTHTIEVDTPEHFGSLHVNAVRAIEVPFGVADNIVLEISSISDSELISIPSGSYAVRCEFLGVDDFGNQHVHLSFVREENPRFAVLLADQELAVGATLITQAQPAVS
ncbi:competence protein ComJ [Dyella mobilis]|uniref:Competence protein J (ComJ) n=1 Tax=Dyella mobilis TaxID=1849582 RepID=A0ABS2KD29_9GAMM|nr:competence protein ComJ [Dyella mobilis]MBM7128788.1 hypothetical protein [Dyella mobilis]GLQ99119.1 hypothetical protein GCM10007863_35390 [Dyella mobilis]